MLQSLYSRLSGSPAAVIIIATALMMAFGCLSAKLTNRLHLPNVTGYILAGIVLGPFCLDCIPAPITEGTAFLADIALAFIAFSTGEYFRIEKLRHNTGKVLLITVTEAFLASAAVFGLTYGILRLDLAFSIVLAALASATAPASTMMTIRQMKAKGDFVDTLLQVVAYDDIAALLAYSIAVSVAHASISGEPIRILHLLLPVGKNLAILALGGLFGLILKLLLPQKKKPSSENRLIIAVTVLFAFCGLCASLGISPLLGCMSMGTVYINVTGDAKLFKQLNYFSPPLLLLFFVRSGVSFDLNALLHPSGSIGGVSLLTIGILYFIVRILGKYAGAFVGCLLTKKPKTTRNYFGLALIPQAGVAIGLSALGARVLGGDMGTALETVILASSVLYELIGPACAKFALCRSKSYSTNIEELVPIEAPKPGEPEKPSVELLIERIRIIQQELAKEPQNEEEHAFTEAAEEHHSSLLP